MLTEDETEIKKAIDTLHRIMLAHAPHGKYTYDEHKELVHYIRGIDYIFAASLGSRICREINKNG